MTSRNGTILSLSVQESCVNWYITLVYVTRYYSLLVCLYFMVVLTLDYYGTKRGLTWNNNQLYQEHRSMATWASHYFRLM